MKRWLIHNATLVLIAALAGLVVMVSGIIPIKASSEHWPITKWLLSFTMSRSVAMNSIGIEAPSDLGTPAMVMKGAGHFQTGCVFCHGSPISEKPRIAQGLRPTPPRLQDKIGDWTPEELFYIVKHGVMFTGMPAFPSQQRDDEVWAVVAFLLELPDLDKAAYRELVFGDETDTRGDEPRLVIQACARCHGLDGMGRETSAFPRLAGLHTDYFVATMKAYANGKRHSGIMEPIAARLTTDEMKDVADYYSSLPLDSDDEQATPADDSKIERGKTIAIDGVPNQDVGACIACHRADRSGHNPAYPAIAGQHAGYLALQLQLFQQRHRGGSQAEMMHTIADGLERDQINEVAEYYESLRWSESAAVD